MPSLPLSFQNPPKLYLFHSPFFETIKHYLRRLYLNVTQDLLGCTGSLDRKLEINLNWDHKEEKSLG